MKTGRRGFMKGVFGVAVAPFLRVFGTAKPADEPAVELPQGWSKTGFTYRYDEGLKKLVLEPPLKEPRYCVIEEYLPQKGQPERWSKDRKLVDYVGTITLKKGNVVRYTDDKCLEVDRVTIHNMAEVGKMKIAGRITTTPEEWEKIDVPPLKEVRTKTIFFKGQALQYKSNLDERDDEIYVGPAVPADFTPGYPRGCRFIKTDTREEIMEKLAAKKNKAYQECIAIHEKMLFADTEHG